MPPTSTRQPAFEFADLFAGIGGFHAVLSHAGGRCVFMSEIDPDARRTYLKNWDHHAVDLMVNSDINDVTAIDEACLVPKHDILAAGFPCQPFSKSGQQKGMEETRGTLFWNIARILEANSPSVILLENVRNLVGPRHKHEWRLIIDTLRELGYRVSDIPTVFSPHLLPPSLGGTPQVRERVFILGTYIGSERATSELNVPPTLHRGPIAGWDPMRWKVDWILDPEQNVDRSQYALNEVETNWIDTWDDLVVRHWITKQRRLPGFPLWLDVWGREDLYPREVLAALPPWKRSHVLKNLAFYRDNQQMIDSWIEDRPEVRRFPESRRKLEWQAQDSPRLWNTLMHLRPSGIRAKAPSYLPALVAITQTSIVGKRRRRITPHEAARAQGLHRDFSFDTQRDSASYKQVGNGVATGAAWYVLREHVRQDDETFRDIPTRIRKAILSAPLNSTGDALSQPAYNEERSPRESLDPSGSNVSRDIQHHPSRATGRSRQAMRPS